MLAENDKKKKEEKLPSLADKTNWESSPLEDLPAYDAQENRASVCGMRDLQRSAVPGCVNTAPVQLCALFIATTAHLFYLCVN